MSRHDSKIRTCGYQSKILLCLMEKSTLTRFMSRFQSSLITKEDDRSINKDISTHTKSSMLIHIFILLFCFDNAYISSIVNALIF